MFVELLPERLVLNLASPYLAGKNCPQALSLATDLYQQKKVSATLEILGEECTSYEECDKSMQMYVDLIDRISDNQIGISEKRKQLTVSFKPSTFCILSGRGADPSPLQLDEAFNRITVIVNHAFKKGVQVTLEAEDHRWADFQQGTYFALLDAGYKNLGTVLQSRLLRTAKDIKRFDQRTRVRLVIGIYNEPSEIAHTSKKTMKELLIVYGRELLSRGAYVELATHDQNCLRQFFSEVILPERIEPDKFEIQFLMGVPRQQLQEMLTTGKYFTQLKTNNNNGTGSSYLQMLANSGVLVRLYLPFGADESAGPYCKRRLKENPNMFVYGLKNLFGI